MEMRCRFVKGSLRLDGFGCKKVNTVWEILSGWSLACLSWDLWFRSWVAASCAR